MVMKMPDDEYIEKLEDEIQQYESLMVLLQWDEAFISGQDPTIPCLLMNDEFFPAADAEPFTLKQAPELLKIFQKDGHKGLVNWVRNKRNKT